MSDPVIRVEDLSKRFWIYGRDEPSDTLRDALASLARAPFRARRNGGGRQAFWALRGLSFTLAEGEVLGIIGRNGAGKSTLLKILSQITEPTTGRVAIRGRVGSLLEVGTGFHPELSGRENIYLNGAILGMKKAEIDRNFDAIVAFAEIDRFLDTPVKRYSSGMYMRLAFSIAAHLEPEILIIDEVLAVGDIAFQKKCLGKMGDVARGGRTVLFVSHNMTAVQSLCDNVLWLQQGEVRELGRAREVVSHYLSVATVAATERLWEDPATAPGNDQVRIRRASVRPQSGSPADLITTRTPLVVEFDYWNLEPGAYLNLSLLLQNAEGVTVLNTFPSNEPVWNGRPFPAGLFRSTCAIPGDLLNDGPHTIQLLVVKNAAHGIYRHDDILTFDVQDSPDLRIGWNGKWPGVVRPNLAWTTERVE